MSGTALIDIEVEYSVALENFVANIALSNNQGFGTNKLLVFRDGGNSFDRVASLFDLTNLSEISTDEYFRHDSIQIERNDPRSLKDSVDDVIDSIRGLVQQFATYRSTLEDFSVTVEAEW